MTADRSEPEALIPALKPLYRIAVPLAWPVVRLAVGWNLIVHGWPKIFRSPIEMAPAYAKIGFEPAVVFAFASTWIEFAGGVGILLGLFTRFFAAAVAIEMLLIFLLYWGNGFSWLNRGYEYVLLWGLVSFAIALRGGGPYSLDRVIGREL
jgi:putative oxidoreductase